LGVKKQPGGPNRSHGSHLVPELPVGVQSEAMRNNGKKRSRLVGKKGQSNRRTNEIKLERSFKVSVTSRGVG